MSASLPKATGGAAAILGAMLGDALGRSVDGLGPSAASLKVSNTDAAVGFIQPGPFETDIMREALPGTPSAASMRALALVEAALLGPAEGEEALDDGLRRVLQLAFPSHTRLPWGALLAPSLSLRGCAQLYAQGIPPVSCAAELPDATLLTAAVMLGAAGTELQRAAVLLRATSKDPVTLCAAITLSEVTRQAAAGTTGPSDVIKAARQAEEQAFHAVRALPGSLSRPPEMGHGALAMSLARAQSASSAQDALADLTHDASLAPEVVLAAVLGVMATEPDAIQRNVAATMRLGGAASAALSTMLGLTGAFFGMKVVPMGWLQSLEEGPAMLSFAEGAASARRGPRLPFPSADVCWKWCRAELAFREGREVTRRTLPPPPRDEQLALFKLE